MATTPTEFGVLLRSLREEAVLTRAELAELAGIEPRTIEALERGVSRHPRPATARVLAEALKLEGQRRARFLAAAQDRPADAQDADAEQPSRERGAPRSPLLGQIRDFRHYIAEKTEDFVGREWLFGAVQEFLDATARGYLLLRGDPGIGKSAVLARLVEKNGYIHHFNIRALGINRTDAFLTNVCAQLIAAFGLEYRAVSPRQSQDGAFLDDLLHRAARMLPPEGKLVIAVDALDEVDRRGYVGGTNVLFLPMRLPDGVYVIATARNDPVPLRTDDALRSLFIDNKGADNHADIRRYVEHARARAGIQAYIAAHGMAEAAFVDEMEQLSEGNFMYLRHVLPQIERGTYRDLAMGDLPHGLRNYYEDQWRRMREQGDDAWFTYTLPVITTLAQAAEPVSVELIAEFTGIRDRARIASALHGVYGFLHAEPASGGAGRARRYSIYHESFREFLAGLEEVAEEGVNLEAARRRIKERLARYAATDYAD